MTVIRKNHCLDKVVDVRVVKQRTVGSEHQPRISRISAEVDVPVYLGRLAPCERVQSVGSTSSSTNHNNRQSKQCKKGHEAEEERDKEVKKDMMDWTAVPRSRRQRKMIQIFVKLNGSKTIPMEVNLQDDSRRHVEADPQRRGRVCDNARESAKENRKAVELRSY